MEDNINQYDEEAKEYANENRDDENFYCYACTADTGLACADPEVVSLVTTWFVDFGGEQVYLPYDKLTDVLEAHYR